MNINERKRTSASPKASQAIVDGHFVHSWMDFVVKFVSANVSWSILNAELCGKIFLWYHIFQLTACKMVQKLC